MGVVGGPDPIVTDDSLLFAVDPANDPSYYRNRN